MPYQKGSTSAAESAIAITKNALRQLCLSNPNDWPELLPTLLQAINSTCIYGSKTSRAQLYFSPYSWQNSLQLNGLLFPEKLYLETHEKLNHLIDQRVFARHLSLIGVFSGVRRNLPREMCTKISIQHLANLQIRLQSHQLQRLSDHLLKANQYMPPSKTRTWQYLMDKKRNDLPYG
jgi:hypothetical protein